MDRPSWTILTALSLVVGLLAAGAATGAAAERGANAQVPRVVELPDVLRTSALPVNSLMMRPDVAAHHGVSLQGPPPRCDKDITTAGPGAHISGVTFIAAQDNIICTSADIDVWQTLGTNGFVVQAGGEEAAFVITDVSNPANPIGVLFKWTPSRVQRGTFTPDVKAFKQGGDRFIALSLERITRRGACGVMIFDVTNPTNPLLESHFIGTDWCDSHNVFVETDVNGDGAFIYAVADATRNMRVLDISGTVSAGSSVTNPVEIGSYTHPCVQDPFDATVPCPLNQPGQAPITFLPAFLVHDMTVIGGRAYVAYWEAGLDIVDPATLKPGNTSDALTDPFDIAPTDFLVHHAYPNPTGDHVFIEDEITFEAGFEPVQMWDISPITAAAYVDGLAPDQGVGGERVPAHNLLVIGSELYVGWYKAGLQVFGFEDDPGDVSYGFTTRNAFHQVQTEVGDDSYSGAWGVRQLNINGIDYVFSSDRNYGLIIDSRP